MTKKTMMLAVLAVLVLAVTAGAQVGMFVGATGVLSGLVGGYSPAASGCLFDVGGTIYTETATAGECPAIYAAAVAHQAVTVRVRYTGVAASAGGFPGYLVGYPRLVSITYGAVTAAPSYQVGGVVQSVTPLGAACRVRVLAGADGLQDVFVVNCQTIGAGASVVFVGVPYPDLCAGDVCQQFDAIAPTRKK